MIPESAAGFAAFVSAAAHLLVALSIAKELPVVTLLIASGVGIDDASFLNHFVALHFPGGGSAEARHVAFPLTGRTGSFVTLRLAQMALGFVVAAGKRFAAGLAASRDRILAGSSRLCEGGGIGGRIFLPFVATSSTTTTASSSSQLLQSRLPARTPLHRFRQSRAGSALSRVTGLGAAVRFDAAAQFLIADAVADERRRKIRPAIVRPRRLTAAAADFDAKSTFGAWRTMANRVAKVLAAVEGKTALGIALNHFLLTTLDLFLTLSALARLSNESSARRTRTGMTK